MARRNAPAPKPTVEEIVPLIEQLSPEERDRLLTIPLLEPLVLTLIRRAYVQGHEEAAARDPESLLAAYEQLTPTEQKTFCRLLMGAENSPILSLYKGLSTITVRALGKLETEGEQLRAKLTKHKKKHETNINRVKNSCELERQNPRWTLYKIARAVGFNSASAMLNARKACAKEAPRPVDLPPRRGRHGG